MYLLKKIPNISVRLGDGVQFFPSRNKTLYPYVVLKDRKIKNYSGRLLVLKDLMWAKKAIETARLLIRQSNEEGDNTAFAAEV